MISKVILQQQKYNHKSGGVTPPVVNNQFEETQYFDAFLLPISQKNNIQSALNEHGAIRLDKGDYSGVNITIGSNQKIYGHPSLTIVSNITILAGSTGIVLDNLFPSDKTITLQSGASISGCLFKSIKNAILVGTNVRFENNTLINYGAPIRIDCTGSGYIRNNKFIKHQSGTVSNLLIMKGNSTTPSYGNVHLHTNFLTPHGDTTDINNLQSSTFVGIDAEGWNLTGDGTKSMLYAQNMGSLKITDFGGGNEYSAVITGAYDIDASNTFIVNKKIRTNFDKLSVRNNMNMVNAIGGYTRQSGTVTGFDLLSNLDDSKTVKYNNIEQTAPVSDPTIISKIKSSILGTRYTPWEKPEWETLPDPLGLNWKINRIGKPDSRNYIQALIDTDKIADLPEGVFYIGSTLLLPLDREHGIIGKGTGKTVIAGLTDDFPLISLTGGQDDNFILANLTLQGGSKGVYSSQDYGTQHMSFVWLKYVVFRDQVNGIHLKQMVGFDNNFFDNISFVNCEIGFFQDPLIGGDSDHSSFVDKTMFYNSQIINCQTSMSMSATRADNLNAWVNCLFDTGNTALLLSNNNYPIVANCKFSGFVGNHLIQSNEISIYSSEISGNNLISSTVKAIVLNLEGCAVSDNDNLMSSVRYNSVYANIINSIVLGSVTNLTVDVDWNSQLNTIIMNSNLQSNSSISKIFSYIKQNVPIVVLNESPDPYPQLLVTQ